jgi:hypothetical protein
VIWDSSAGSVGAGSVPNDQMKKSITRDRVPNNQSKKKITVIIKSGGFIQITR